MAMTVRVVRIPLYLQVKVQHAWGAPVQICHAACDCNGHCAHNLRIQGAPLLAQHLQHSSYC